MPMVFSSAGGVDRSKNRLDRQLERIYELREQRLGAV